MARPKMLTIEVTGSGDGMTLIANYTAGDDKAACDAAAEEAMVVAEIMGGGEVDIDDKVTGLMQSGTLDVATGSVKGRVIAHVEAEQSVNVASS